MGKENNLDSIEMKRNSHEEGRASVYDSAALDDVKNFSESLLQDLNATRENLFVWMKEEMNKLVADDDITAPKRGTKRGPSGGKKAKLVADDTTAPKTVKSKGTSRGKKAKLQNHNNFIENTGMQHQKAFEESTQEQRLSNNGGIAHVQQQNNFQEGIEVQHQNNFEQNIQLQHQNNSNSHTIAQNRNAGSLERFAKSIKPTDSNTHCQSFDHQVDYGLATGPVTSTGKGEGEKLAFSADSNFQSDPSNQNVQMQHPKSVVLAIRAQNCNDEYSEKSAKGKKTASSNKNCQAREDQAGYKQAMKSMTSTEKDEAERFSIPVEQSFPPDLSDHVGSSMYLTLPTVLPKHHDSNNTSFSNYIQPRTAGNKTNMYLGIGNQMLDSGAYSGYHPSMEPEGRSGTLSQMGFRNISSFDQNGTPTSSGFPVSLHKGMGSGLTIPGQFCSEDLPLENRNTLGVSVNGGGMTFSGGDFTFFRTVCRQQHPESFKL